MFKKIISCLMIFSFIFNSYLSDIIVFASEINKEEVVEMIKNLGSDFEIEDGVLVNYKGKDKKVIIPEDVVDIGKEAFKDNDKVEIINIHDNVQRIEESAFEGCSNLKAISIPNSIQSIGNFAFKDCVKLSSITIPSPVSTLDKNVFEGCQSLSSIVVLNETLNGDFLDISSKKSIKLYGLRNSKLEQFANNKKYEFQEIYFYDDLLLRNKDIEIGVGEEQKIQIELMSEKFNEPITYISEDEDIVYVDKNGNVKGLKEGKTNIYLFTNSRGMEYETINVNVNKEKSVESLNSSDLVYGDYEYSIDNDEIIITGYTGSASSISIPSYIDGMLVTEIGNRAFEDCETLIQINLPESIKTINLRAFYGIELESFKLPPKIETIGASIITSSKITKVFIPKTVKSMNSAFSSLENLEEVEFEEGIEKIPTSALGNCKSLKIVKIPNSVIDIEGFAFRNCENLTQISLPESITHISLYAFHGIELESFKLPPKIEYIGSSIINSSKITKLFIPKTVKTMGTAFSSLENLEEVEFEEGIEKIPYRALDNCKNIKKVILPRSVISIGTYAFRDITDLTIYGYRGSFAEIYAFSNNINFKGIYEDYIVDVLGIRDKLNKIKFNGGTVKGPVINIFGEKIPLFELNANVNIPLDKSIQVRPNIYTKTIEVLIGFKDFDGSASLDPNVNNKKWNESYNQVKSLYKGMGIKHDSAKFSNDFKKLKNKLKGQKGTILVGGDVYAAGYMEFNYESGKLRLSEGGIITEVGINASKNYRWAPPYSAVYTTLGFKTGADGKIHITPNNEQLVLNTNIGANFGVNAGIGAGSKNIAGGVYAEGIIKGTLNGDVKLPASSAKEALSIYCNLGVKLALVAFGYDLTGGKLEHTFPNFNLYPWNSGQYLLELNSTNVDIKSAKPISRDYLKKQSKNQTYSVGRDFIKENLYPYNSPQLVNLGNGKKLLVWVDDTGEKTIKNRTSLMYSVFSGGKWSEPKTIAETGTYNDNANIYVKDGKAHILWRKSNKVLSENTSLEDLIKTLDLYYIVYDGNEFSKPIQITKNNNICDMHYDIAVTDDKVAITWVENSENDITSENGNYTLYAKEYINGQEQEKITITSNKDEIHSTDIDYINNKYEIVYGITENYSDESQVSDIYLYNDGNINKIELETKNNYSPEFIDSNLYFINDNSLKIYNTLTKDIEDTGINEISNFSMVSNGNSKAIVTMIPSEDSFELLASYYNSESKTWGPWKQVTSNEQFIRNYSVVMDDDSTICAALNLAEITDNESSVFGKSTLIVSGLKEISDLSVGDGIYYDYDKVVPNGELDLNFEVSNNSSENLETLNISILDENNKIIEESNIECNILANETKEVTYTYKLPEKINFNKIKIFVKPSYDEVKIDNNIAEISIGYGDISLDNVKINKKQNKYIVTGNVSNIGYTDCENIKLSVYDTSVNGDILGSVDIGTLEVGNSKEISYILPQEFISNKNVGDEVAIYLNLESSTEEASLSNNETRMLFTVEEPNIEKIENISITNKTSNSISLSWDKLDGFDGYEIYRSTSEDSKYSLVEEITSPDTLNYIDTNLSPGEIYYYKVRAYKLVNGEKVYSEDSSVVSAMTELLKPITSVKNLTYNSNKITWNEVPYTSGYEVYSSTSETGTYSKIGTITSGNTLSYTHKDLLTGSTYYYKVRAYRTVNGKNVYGNYSSIVSAKPTLASTSAKAQNVSYNSNKVTWSNVSGANGYEVYSSTSEKGTYSKVGTITSGSTVSYTHKSLSTGITYYYKVRAYRTVNGKNVYGNYSSIVSAKPIISSVSAKVQNVSYNSNKVTWSNVSGANGYEVYSSTSEKGTYSKVGTITSGSTLSYTHKSLSTGSTYYYKVRAYRTVNGKNVYGNYSSIVSAKPTLQSVSAKVQNVSYNSNKVTWTKVSGASGYEVYSSTSKTGKYSKVGTITSGSTVSYTHKSLSTGSTYYYKVRAYRTVNGKKVYGNYSSVVSAKPILSKPTITLSTQTKKAYVKWSKVSGASGYEIYRSTSKNGTYSKIKTINNGSTISYTNSSLTSKKTYYYKVRAYRTVNGKKVYSSYSDIKSIKIK